MEGWELNGQVAVLWPRRDGVVLEGQGSRDWRDEEWRGVGTVED